MIAPALRSLARRASELWNEYHGKRTAPPVHLLPPLLASISRVFRPGSFPRRQLGPATSGRAGTDTRRASKRDVDADCHEVSSLIAGMRDCKVFHERDVDRPARGHTCDCFAKLADAFWVVH